MKSIKLDSSMRGVIITTSNGETFFVPRHVVQLFIDTPGTTYDVVEHTSPMETPGE